MVEHVRLWPDELYVARQYINQPFLFNVEYYQIISHLPYMWAAQAMSLLGWDLYLLRWPAVMAAVLSVPLLFVMGSRIFNQKVGVVAAVLLAISYFHIDLSWRIRGYTFVLLLVTIGVYFVVRGVNSTVYRWWIASAVAIGLAIHTHMFVVFALPPIALYLLLSYWQTTFDDRRLLVKQIVLAGSILTLLLLLIPLLLAQNELLRQQNTATMLGGQSRAQFPPFTPNHLLTLLESYSQFNDTLSPLKISGWLALVFFGVVLLGIWAAFQPRAARLPSLLLLLLLFFPPLITTVLVTVLPPWFFGFHRFFIYVLPPYLFFGSVGLLWLVQRITGPRRPAIATVLLSACLLLLFTSVAVRIFAPASLSSRPTQVARYLQQHAATGDIILCVPQETGRTPDGTRHFCSMNLNFYPELSPKTFMFDHVTDFQTLAEFLNPNTVCRGYYSSVPSTSTAPKIGVTCDPVTTPAPPVGIWLVLWRDQLPSELSVRPDFSEAQPVASIGSTELFYVPPLDTLAVTLAEAAKIAATRADSPERIYLNSLSLANVLAATGDVAQARALLDDLPAAPRTFEPPGYIGQPVQAQFGPPASQPQLKLLGYHLPSRRISPGDSLPITVYWQALAPISQQYLVFNHLLDSTQTHRGGYDRIPRQEYNTFLWQPGEVVVDEYTISVDADAPDGVYWLHLGLYLLEDNQAVSLPLYQGGQPIDATSVAIGPIKVGGPPPEVLAEQIAPQQPVNVDFGGIIRLNGFDMPALGLEQLDLRLYWESLAGTDVDYTVFVHLRDPSGSVAAQMDRPPANGSYPTSLWSPGEVIADAITIPLPETLPPGPFTLVVGLYDFTTGARLPVADSPDNNVTLTQVEIE